MALTTRVWSAGKLLVLAGALFLTYVLFAAVGMRVALKTREVVVPALTGSTKTTSAEVNGPPVAPASRLTLGGVPPAGTSRLLSVTVTARFLTLSV